MDRDKLMELAERLDTIWKDDHERGCQMRFYSCSCGFDEATWKTAEDAAAALRKAVAERDAEIEKLRTKLKQAADNLGCGAALYDCPGLHAAEKLARQALGADHD